MYVDLLLETLAEKNKVAGEYACVHRIYEDDLKLVKATGGCGCVGIVGPGLGGGFGL